MEMEVDDPSHADGARDGDSDGDHDKVEITTDKKRKSSTSPSTSPSPSTASVPAAPGSTSSKKVKTSNLKTKENRSKEYMTPVQAGADGHTQQEAKDAGVIPEKSSRSPSTASVPAPVSTSSNKVIDDVDMEVDVPGHADADADDETAEEADAPTDASTAAPTHETGKQVLNAQATPFVPLTASVPAASGSTSSKKEKTSNLKTKENRSKEYMTIKAGADGHTQPAAKNAGVRSLVEEMTRTAFQVYIEGSRFVNMVVLAIVSQYEVSSNISVVTNDAAAAPVQLPIDVIIPTDRTTHMVTRRQGARPSTPPPSPSSPPPTPPPLERPERPEVTQALMYRCLARCWSESQGDHASTRPEESAYLDHVFTTIYRRPGVQVPPLASCPRGQGFSQILSYLAKEYVVSCRNHVLLKFHRRWYGLVRRMLEDSVPVFDVHKEPKPGKDAKKLLKEVASKLVRIVAQAVAKE